MEARQAWAMVVAGILVGACVVETEPGPKKRLLRDLIPPTPPSAAPLPPRALPPPSVAIAVRVDASTTDARLPAAHSGNDGGF